MRVYEENLKMSRQPLDSSKSFEEELVSESVTYILESKQEDKEFAEYDPNQIVVKVYNFNENIMSVYDAFYSLLYTNKCLTIAQFQKELSLKYLIPYNNLLIFVKKPYFMSVVQLNTPDKANSLLAENAIDCSSSIYIEEQTNPDERKWDTLFVEEKSKAIISFNNPKTTNAENIPIYDMSITIDNREPLKELKNRISQIVNLTIIQDRHCARTVQVKKRKQVRPRV